MTATAPLTRLLALLLLAPMLPSLALPDLAGLALLLFAGYRWSAPDALGRLGRGLMRLRWLLLSILVLYLGFTPGEPLTPWTPGFSQEGLHEGTRRALVLVALMCAVYWLLAVTPVPELVGALDQLFRPLRRLGVPTERFTRRLGLTLAVLDRVEAELRRLQAAGHRGLDLAVAWLRSLETAPPAVAVPAVAVRWPRGREWLALAGLLALLWWWPR